MQRGCYFLAVIALSCLCFPAWGWNSATTLTSDTFYDRNFTSSPTWVVIDADANHPWSALTRKLIAPIGVQSMKPTIRLNFSNTESNRMVEITLKVRNPYVPGDYQPLLFSIIDSGTGNGYNLYANPYSSAYGDSGAAWSTYDNVPQNIGVSGAALGKNNPQNWETVVIRFDPVNHKVTMTCDGALLLSFTDSQDLSRINRFEITNYGYQVPWEFDDVYVKVSAPDNVIVNSGTVVSQTGGDDLKRLRSYFDTASWEFGQSPDAVNTLNVVGVKGTRCINVGGSYLDTNGVFIPSSRLSESLSNIRAYNWKAHYALGESAPSNLPANASTWTTAQWSAYSAYAAASVRHIAQYSGPGLVVADDFYDGEYSNNPSWTVVTEDALHPWTVANNRLYMPVGVAETNPRLRLDFSALSSTETTYITFSLRNPYEPGDYQPICFSIVDSASGNGYNLFGNPYPAVFGNVSGCAWSTYGNGPQEIGVAGEALGYYNPTNWETICIKFDPVGNTVTMSRNGHVVLSFTNTTIDQINRFEIANMKEIIPWEICNFHIGSRPRNPGGDNFNDGNFSANPAWTVVNADASHPWTVSGKHLVMPIGVSGFYPAIAMNLQPSEPGQVIQIAFDIRCPYNTADYQPVYFSLLNSSSNTGYNLFANPNSSAYGGNSGFAWSTYPNSPQYGGVAGEALNILPQKWEHMVIKFDPENNLISMTRNGSKVLEFSNSLGLEKIDKLVLTNWKEIVPWEIDNVYAWYGNEPLPEIIIEVDNEKDVATSAWFISGTYGMGSEEMYDAYYQIFKVWANAVEQASLDISRPLCIAGPAATSFTFHSGYGDFNWPAQLAADCGQDGIRLDDLTVHLYGNAAALLDRTSPLQTVFPSAADHIATMRTALDNAGLTQARVAITEWGPDWHVDGSSYGIINTNQVGAAWTAAFLEDLLSTKAEKAVFLIFRNHLFYDPNDPRYLTENWTWCSFLSNVGLYPKPIYNLCRMFTMMPGKRVSVSGLSNDLGGIVSADNNAVGVMIYNYKWDFESQTDQTITQAVNITVNNIPFSSGSATVTRYLIDETHSNVYQYIKNNLSIQLSGSELQQVESYSAPVSNGSITLPVCGLNQSAVSFWLITPAQ